MDKSNIVREFDGKAEDYERYRLGGWYIAQLQRLLPHIVEDTEGDVLDIGCGSGWLLRTLAAAQPARRYVGVDLSPKMVEKARENVSTGAGNVEFIAADWEAMELADLSQYRFSSIICTSTFHYFADPPAALKKIHHLLIEHGSFFLLERDKTASPLTALWDVLHRYLIKDHVKFYSSDELRSMLTHVGFSKIEMLDTIRRYFWHGKVQTNVVLLRGRKIPTKNPQFGTE